MAKYGEGDKRWIVSERADGTNVHNWHWVERDCLEWSRSLLSSLLSDLTLLNGEGGIFIRTKTLDKLDGEAYVNVRKGKVIPGYELSLSLSFEAETRSDSSSVDGNAEPLLRLTGSFEVPYLADENAGDDPEVRITVRDDDGPIGRRIKDAFIAKGKPVVLEKIRSYVLAMSKGGPAKDELEEKIPPLSSVKKAAVPLTASKESADIPVKKPKKEKEGFKTIKLTERFSCRARDIYEILMDENRWKGFTQSNAMISKEVGGQFSLFDGSITGINEELQEGKLIVQKWRFNNWVDGIYSSVRLDFDEPEPGIAIVKLTQTGVPQDDRFGNSTVVENTEKGWRELIFHKIRALFGFGI
ncbi:activator of 90 kDa heat shock protein ATPase homolog [Phalaenopsis equestris]|uniref:activator of 90 kDa heat shock protein ATPase homolog n=1 Tax=Phalaenopsis equestris TaxID=78828 RepID=UPI0009E53A84|nr:activator of 90 kDa heat shock protein ATPase homolog [Phalaenopsis equestris]